MREIKFRAWDKKYSKIEPDVIKNLPWTGRTFEDVVKDDRYILMQYTGMKDIYDKEIYEGDVLRNPEHPEDGLAVVVFNPYGYWALSYTYPNGVVDYYPLDDYVTDDFCVHAYEIVGNIYETQKLYKILELMEEKDGD